MLPRDVTERSLGMDESWKPSFILYTTDCSCQRPSVSWRGSVSISYTGRSVSINTRKRGLLAFGGETLVDSFTQRLQKIFSYSFWRNVPFVGPEKYSLSKNPKLLGRMEMESQSSHTEAFPSGWQRTWLLNSNQEEGSVGNSRREGSDTALFCFSLSLL